MSNNKVQIEAYIEEKQFINEKGETVNYLSLSIPVTDKTTKNIKADKLVLELAKERALRNSQFNIKSNDDIFPNLG